MRQRSLSHRPMARAASVAAIVTTCLCVADAQTPAPNLTKTQREILQSLVQAVDAAQSQPEAADVSWQSHVMRASDGSHYVAFTIEPANPQSLPASAVVYVRLATASAGAAQPVVERSAVRDWLAGSRTDPRLLPRRAIAIGDMPAFGAGGIAARGSTPSTGSTDLKLMDLERERQKQEQEERERQRKAQLEGKTTAQHDLLPFEDFDLSFRTTTADGRRGISRALTAGPGHYDIFVAWADPLAPKPASSARVARHTLHLPVAATGLSLGSIVLASAVTQRDAPYSPAEQSAHPYSIGAMEITPTHSPQLTRDQNLTAVFQIVNAQADAAGMPDVAVGLRIVRVSGEREQQVASLSPQTYNAASLPADFNLRAGHPLFAAISAPLATLSRGTYRLKVVASDRIAGTATAGDADFTIAATPLSLLDEAPRWGVPLDRARLISPQMRAALVDRLAPQAPSAALARALNTAREGRLIELLAEEPVNTSEQPVRVALTALALISVGDSSAVVQLQRAAQLGAPEQPIAAMIGMARASQGRDSEALAAWDLVRADGALGDAVAEAILDTALRVGDLNRASRIAAADHPATTGWRLSGAALAIATGRESQALEMLSNVPPGDESARWLTIHALFAKIARGRADESDRERFAVAARQYISDAGRNSDLVNEWITILGAR